MMMLERKSERTPSHSGMARDEQKELSVSEAEPHHIKFHIAKSPEKVEGVVTVDDAGNVLAIVPLAEGEHTDDDGTVSVTALEKDRADFQ